MNDLSNEDLRIFAGVLVQAAAGEKIQARNRDQTRQIDWSKKDDLENWFPGKYEYRVAPPEPREVWINLYGRGSKAYDSEKLAYACLNTDIRYDGIAVHFKEVMENDD